MPTAPSSTDRATRTTSAAVRSELDFHVRDAPRAIADVGHLIRFRTGTVRRRSTFPIVVGVFVVLTAAVILVPALIPGAGDADKSSDAFSALLLLPTGLAGFLALSLASAVASGGGRELIPHDQAAAYPISPTTDHLGALLLAPLNIAWLLQGWILLGTTAYAVGRDALVSAESGVFLWLLAATATAQVAAWLVEGVRRTAHGVALVRLLALAALSVVLWLQLTHELTHVLDRIPTASLVGSIDFGLGWRWLVTVVLELGVLVVAVVLGAFPAHWAARRTPRDEQKVESESHPARRMPRSPLSALVRTDRASVWRAVPMRRGMAVLAVGPGVVALLGNLQWSTMTVLPGLVASGGALLFGVNAWCLDGRGGLWRESLPVPAVWVFTARAYVLAEFLAAASLLTLVLAGLRAGVPDPAELAALVCTWLVVTLQVVSASMRWSSQRPFAVDLRSARATPAPPSMMVSYSARLAVSTTLTSLVFSGTAHSPFWQASVLVAIPFLLWSGFRVLRARDRWVDPFARALVVTTVAV